MITERDNDIIKHLEKYSFITIRQANKIYFRDCEFGYATAAKRLAEIVECDYARLWHDKATNRNIYLYKGYDMGDDDCKSPSMSRVVTNDVLAEAIYNGFNVEYFKPEKWWMDGQVRSDALLIFTLKDQRYYFFIETHFASHFHNLDKYDKLYESGEVQKFLDKKVFPRILFISDRQYSKPITVKYTEVIQLDSHLHQFPSILLVKK